MTYLLSPHIRAVLFDHDDTLVATYRAKFAEHKYIAKTYYNRELTDADILPHWGKPLRALMTELYDTDDVEQALAYNLSVHSRFPKLLLHDTIKTLTALHQAGKKLGVITATHRISFNYDLETLGIPSSLFDYTQTEEETTFHKPHPRVFDPAKAWLKQEMISPDEVLYVGDALNDLRAAHGAGFEFVGVCTGLCTAAGFKLYGASTITKLGDLTNIET